MTRQLTSRILLLVPLLASACDRPQTHGPSKPTSKQQGAKAAVKGTPKITCAAATYDFGKVSEGEKVEHVFVIKNEGNGVLEIKRASAG